jgi:hypothetical protein
LVAVAAQATRQAALSEEINVTIEEQALTLEKSLVQLESMRKKPWLTTAERREVVESTKAQLAAAEATLRLPATPDTAYARRQLILWAEMASGTLRAPEYQ